MHVVTRFPFGQDCMFDLSGHPSCPFVSNFCFFKLARRKKMFEHVKPLIVILTMLCVFVGVWLFRHTCVCVLSWRVVLSFICVGVCVLCFACGCVWRDVWVCTQVSVLCGVCLCEWCA